MVLDCDQRRAHAHAPVGAGHRHGLSPEQVASLFQPFNRLGQETGTEEGTGIGLVVTKRLVELMGGSIGVTSSARRRQRVLDRAGAAPRRRTSGLADRRRAAADRRATPSASTAESAPRLLLYVEDNPANLRLVRGNRGASAPTCAC